MKKIKRRALGRKEKVSETKVCPDIEVSGPLKVREERVGFGSSGVATNNYWEKVKEEKIGIEDKISERERERLKFFDEFFSEDNKMPLGRIMVYDNGFPRRYTVVKFARGNFNDASSIILDPSTVPVPIKGYNNGLEEYLRYLYINMVTEVEYFEGITDEEFQAMIKTLFVSKDLTMVEHNVADAANSIKTMCLTDRKNALYWLKKDIVPILNDEYLKSLKNRYEKDMDGRVDEPDLDSLYGYFKENPNPGMQVLQLEKNSTNMFKHLTGGK